MRFVSLFVAGCVDVLCLIFFWLLSRVSRSVLSVVCVLCLIPAVIACMLVSLHFCFVWGCAWAGWQCLCCVAGAFPGPCVRGNCVT